jgi:diguanylate cyclase (GGDEF)-like protein
VASLGFIFMTKERADETNRLLAAADPLTGAANRRAIIEALNRDVARAIRTREPLALMMLDLDHFKRINDTYGHLAGDAVLRSLMALVRQRIRSQDIVGRYGGEEFLVVLPDTPLAGVERLAQDLCDAVAAHSVVYQGQRIPVTVSIGAVGGRLELNVSWDVLIHAADKALYRAKDAGRNRIEVTTDMAPIRRSHDPDLGLETFPPSMTER